MVQRASGFRAAGRIGRFPPAAARNPTRIAFPARPHFRLAGRQRPSCCLLPAVLLHDAGSLHHRFTAWWFRVRRSILLCRNWVTEVSGDARCAPKVRKSIHRAPLVGNTEIVLPVRDLQSRRSKDGLQCFQRSKGS